MHYQCDATSMCCNVNVPSNLQRPKDILVRIDARPKLSSHRRAHLYCQWKSGVGQLGTSLVQSLHSSVATFGLGWRGAKSKGIEWVVSWSRGNATINIPISVSTKLTEASLGRTMYLSLISYYLSTIPATKLILSSSSNY